MPTLQATISTVKFTMQMTRDNILDNGSGVRAYLLTSKNHPRAKVSVSLFTNSKGQVLDVEGVAIQPPVTDPPLSEDELNDVSLLLLHLNGTVGCFGFGSRSPQFTEVRSWLKATIDVVNTNKGTTKALTFKRDFKYFKLEVESYADSISAVKIHGHVENSVCTLE